MRTDATRYCRSRFQVRGWLINHSQITPFFVAGILESSASVVSTAANFANLTLSFLLRAPKKLELHLLVALAALAERYAAWRPMLLSG